MHPLTARAAGADGFDFKGLREFAALNYATLSDQQARELFDIVGQLVYQLVEYSLGVDAKDLRKYAAHFVQLLDDVVSFGSPTAQEKFRSTGQHANAAAASAERAKASKLLARVMVTHLSAQNVQLQRLDALARRAGSSGLVTHIPILDRDPEQLIQLISDLTLQVRSLVGQYDSRDDNLPTSRQIVRHSRVSMQEMIRALHVWASAKARG